MKNNNYNGIYIGQLKVLKKNIKEYYTIFSQNILSNISWNVVNITSTCNNNTSLPEERESCGEVKGGTFASRGSSAGRNGGPRFFRSLAAYNYIIRDFLRWLTGDEDSYYSIIPILYCCEATAHKIRQVKIIVTLCNTIWNVISIIWFMINMIDDRSWL